jgi:hypothetical protein
MLRRAPLLPDSAIKTMAAAVFARPDPWVSEAYSAFDVEPRQFSSTDELADYIRTTVAEPRGLAYFFVLYPDMAGRAVRETIRLKPGSVPGHKLRYTWQGWGLISVQLVRDDQLDYPSRVSANSLARAEKWASTKPSWDLPSTWNWKAVTSHARRLQRVLNSVTSDGGGSVNLAKDILDRARSDFAGGDHEETIKLLQAYSGPETDRVQRCVLYLSGGEPEKLKHFLQTAQSDYRDVILFAEYDSASQRVRDFSRGFNHA